MGAAASFPYAMEEELPWRGDAARLWVAFVGYRKDDGERVTVFRFDRKAKRHLEDAARNAVQRLKTMRHPHVLKFIDEAELPDVMFVVTEECSPLSSQLDNKGSLQPMDANLLGLGLYQVSQAVAFMNNECSLVHGAVSFSSIYATKGGDWKLFGFESTMQVTPSQNIHHPQLTTLESRYKPPELVKSNIIHHTAWSLDAWCLACLIYEAFNGYLQDPRQLTRMGSIPEPLQIQYRKLLATSPEKRLNTNKVASSAYFKTDFVRSMEFLENLAMKSTSQKEKFFGSLADRLQQFPSCAAIYKVLPHLSNALSYGSATSGNVLECLLHLGTNLKAEEYAKLVIPTIIKMYSFNERAVRISLLKHIDMYMPYLSDADVNKKVFPCVRSGFTDTVSLLREWTVKSLIAFAPKLDEKTMLTSVIPFISKLQKDPEPAIRTNTVVVVGKCAKLISAASRTRLLLPTCQRALRDPFNPARRSAVAALKATSDFYTPKEIASKIMPMLSLHLVDPAKVVRESAFSAIALFTGILQAHSETMIEPELLEPTVSPPSQKTSPDLLGSIWPQTIDAAPNKKAAVLEPIQDPLDMLDQVLSDTRSTIDSFDDVVDTDFPSGNNDPIDQLFSQPVTTATKPRPATQRAPKHRIRPKAASKPASKSQPKPQLKPAADSWEDFLNDI